MNAIERDHKESHHRHAQERRLDAAPCRRPFAPRRETALTSNPLWNGPERHSFVFSPTVRLVIDDSRFEFHTSGSRNSCRARKSNNSIMAKDQGCQETDMGKIVPAATLSIHSFQLSIILHGKNSPDGYCVMMIAIVSHFLEATTTGQPFECPEKMNFRGAHKNESNGSCIVAPRANDSIGRAIKSGVEHHVPNNNDHGQ
jgi:hypothetical protein